MPANLPKEFINRVQSIIPKKQWDDFNTMCTDPLPKTIRINPLKTTLPELPETFKLSKTNVPEGFFIHRDDHSIPLGKTLPHFCGHIYVQTLSSMLPVHVVDFEPDLKILDMCSAPGSKTTFIAEKLGNTGVIVANEPSSTRSKKLAANLNRMGAHNTVMTQYDGTKMNTLFDQEFDIVFLDAPCSSEGYGRKNHKFYQEQWSLKSIHECAKLQQELLKSAFEVLRPDGLLIYSTCTTAPEENEQALTHFLNQTTEAELLSVNLKDIPHTKGINNFNDQKFSSEISDKVQRLWPHLRSKTWSSECFFVSAITKKAPLKDRKISKNYPQNPIKIHNKAQQAELSVKLAKQFGWDRNVFNQKHLALIEKDEEIYLTTKMAAQFAAKNAHRRLGLKIIDKHKNPTTELGMHFAHLASKNVIDLDPKQTKRWLEGFDLESTVDIKGSVLVRHKKYGLGWGKISPGKLKNKLNRDLVF